MREPDALIATAKAAVPATGAGITVVLDQVSLAVFGIPVAAVSAAATGALVPALLLEPEPIIDALRRWVGAVAFSLCLTALVLLALELQRGYTIGIAALLAMFARDLHSTLRGQVPPLFDGLRRRVFGGSEAGK